MWSSGRRACRSGRESYRAEDDDEEGEGDTVYRGIMLPMMMPRRQKTPVDTVVDSVRSFVNMATGGPPPVGLSRQPAAFDAVDALAEHMAAEPERVPNDLMEE